MAIDRATAKAEQGEKVADTREMSAEKIQQLEAQTASREITAQEQNAIDGFEDRYYQLADQIKKERVLDSLRAVKDQLDALKQNRDIREILGNDQSVIDRVIPKFLGPSYLKFDDFKRVIDIKHPRRESKKHGWVQDDIAKRALALIDGIRNQIAQPEVQVALKAAKDADGLFREIDGAMYDAESEVERKLKAEDPAINEATAERIAKRDPSASELRRLKDSVYKRMQEFQSLVGPT
jgi:hypothetical protein